MMSHRTSSDNRHLHQPQDCGDCMSWGVRHDATSNSRIHLHSPDTTTTMTFCSHSQVSATATSMFCPHPPTTTTTGTFFSHSSESRTAAAMFHPHSQAVGQAVSSVATHLKSTENIGVIVTNKATDTGMGVNTDFSDDLHEEEVPTSTAFAAGSHSDDCCKENMNTNTCTSQTKDVSCKEKVLTLPQPLAPEESCCHGSDPALAPGTGRRKRRKPLHPQKSLSPWDPDFCGVTLCFHTVLQGGHSELIITPIYSKNLTRCRHRRSRRLNSESEHDGQEGQRSPADTFPGDCVQEPVHSPPCSTAGKSCASCGTRRTPLWRDAEDGTPLCNACGIRYRKYRLRCASCWHIPRKDNKVFPACSQCGGVLRFSQARKC